MNSIIALIQALSAIVLPVLQAETGLPATIAALITGIESAVAEFVTIAKSGDTVTAASILAAIAASVSVLQSQTNLSPIALSYLKAFSAAASAGLSAYQSATSVNPTAVQPITPLP